MMRDVVIQEWTDGNGWIHRVESPLVPFLLEHNLEPVRHGRWEERRVIDDKCIEEWQSARCSVCGRYHTTPYMYNFDRYTYCPNCGAKMDGVNCGSSKEGEDEAD